MGSMIVKVTAYAFDERGEAWLLCQDLATEDRWELPVGRLALLNILQAICVDGDTLVDDNGMTARPPTDRDWTLVGSARTTMTRTTNGSDG